MNRRISALEARVHELAQSNAVLSSQVTPVARWVESQMTNGLTQRMDVLEEDMGGVKNSLDELRSMAQKVMGGGAVLLFLWGIFGDSIKKGLLGK